MFNRFARAVMAGFFALVGTTFGCGGSFAESFDFNGIWTAFAGSEYETEMRFTIKNNMLTSVSCGTSGTVTFSPPPSVSNGEFSFLGHDGLGISGRIVSAVSAVGTINIAPCSATRWWGTKE